MIKRNPREIILSALLRMSEQMPFYIFTVFVLEYGPRTSGFEKTFVTNAVDGGRGAGAVLVPFFGHLSDKIGRKRMYIAGAVADAACGRSRTSRCSTRRVGARVRSRSSCR